VAKIVAKDHSATSDWCAAAPQRNIGVVDDGVEQPLFNLPSADPTPVDSLPSLEEIEQARTPAGGWAKQQLGRWGVAWPPPKGWRHDLERRYQQAHRSP
jgi:hypothetical protein